MDGNTSSEDKSGEPETGNVSTEPERNSVAQRIANHSQFPPNNEQAISDVLSTNSRGKATTERPLTPNDHAHQQSGKLKLDQDEDTNVNIPDQVVSSIQQVPPTTQFAQVQLAQLQDTFSFNTIELPNRRQPKPQ